MFKEKKSTHIIVFLAVVLSLLFFTFIKKSKNTNPKIEPENSVKVDKSTPLGCTRKTRLDNLPQYDRALSLIQQRLIVNQKRFKYNNRALFTLFLPELTNCIKVVEKPFLKKDDFEGYFTFNGKDIKNNYYPIVVNSKYEQADDVLITLLLAHEMTHVQQYIDSVNRIKTYSCLDSEVDAFMASRQFYISGLNNEEMNAVSLRINEAIDNNKKIGSSQYIDRPFDYQLLMLDAIQKLYSSPHINCKYVDINDVLDGKVSGDEYNQYIDCVDKDIPALLKKIIENDNYYQKQCKL